jgi:hypothetical protein
MTSICGIPSAAKRLALTVLALGVLAAFWSASAFAQSALGASAGSLVGNATQVVGGTTAPVTATVQSTVSSAAAAESSALAAPADSAATTGTATVVATTAAASSNAVGSTLTTATGDVVKPVVDTVAQTVESASDSLSSTSESTLASVSASLADGALPPKVHGAAARAAAPLSDPVAGSSNIVPIQADEQAGGAIDVIAPTLDSTVVPAAPHQAIPASQSRVADPGSQATLRQAQRAHVTPSDGTIAPILTGPRALTFPPARHVTAVMPGGSLPRVPGIPAGFLAGTSASGASGGSGGLVAALIAALLLAVPRLRSSLRPAVATRPLPIPQLSLERPG